MLTYGSLFAGAGGGDIGMDAAGLSCRWQVEIDARCRSVLGRHWPAVERHADIRECGRHNLQPVDVILGGFPCQDLSVAGARAGLEGKRSGLFYELARVCFELRPRFLVVENVGGLLSSDDGRDFGRVLRHLGDGGFFGAWRVLDAEGFGVAQTRRRVFGVFAEGRAGADRCAEVLALAESVSGHPAKGGTPWEDVAGTLGSGPPGSGFRTDLDRAGCFVPTIARSICPGHHPGGFNGQDIPNLIATYAERGKGHATFVPAETAGSLRAGGGGAVTANLVAFGGNDTRGERRVAAALSAKGGTGRIDFETETFVVGLRTDGIAHALTGEGADASEDGTGRGTPIIAVGQCHGGNVGPMGTLRRGNGSVTGGVPFLAFSCKDDGGDAGPVSPTLRAMSHDGSHANAGGQVAVCVPIDMRQASRGATMTNNRKSGSSGGAPGTGVGTDGDPCPTLAGSHVPAVGTVWGVRRLTPRECERLMGWPDDWTRWDDKGREIKDGPRYRMIGNGIAAPKTWWIGRRLIAAARPAADRGGPAGG